MKTRSLCKMKYAITVCCTLLFFTQLQAQISGARTVGGTGANYSTIAAAIADLNALGVGGGGARFLVAAGHREVAANLVIVASGNISDSIIFIKNGTGANPLRTMAAIPIAPETIIARLL
ncbi:MAG: hypothetical protein V4590_15075 [Bacteroidota bacterium]